MATLEEFKEYAKRIKIDRVAVDMPTDNVFDSVVFGGKLRDAHILGDLDEIQPRLSDDTKEILNTSSYLSKELFVDDYSKMTAGERNQLSGEVYKKEREDVEKNVDYLAAKKLVEDVPLDQAQGFIDNVRKARSNTKEIENKTFQRVSYITKDKVEAYEMTRLHRQATDIIGDFNLKYIDYLIDNQIKLEKMKGDAPKDVEKFWKAWKEDNMEDLAVSHGALRDTIDAAKALMDPDNDKYVQDINVQRDVDLMKKKRKKGTEKLTELLSSKKEWINYTTARRTYMHEEHGYPLDYEVSSFDDEAIQAEWPIFAAIATAMTGPTAGAGKWAYGAAGFALDSPMSYAVEYGIEELSEISPILAAGTTIAAVMLVGPKAETALAKLLMSPTKAGKGLKNFVIKPGTEAEQITKAVKNQGLDISEEYGDLMYASAAGDYVGSPLGKLLKTASTDLDESTNRLAYMLPQTNYNMNMAEIVEIGADNVDVAKGAIRQIEHNAMKGSLIKEFDKRTFESYHDNIKVALNNNDFDGAVDLINTHWDEAYDMSRGIIDDTKDFVPDVDPNFLHRSFYGLMPEGMKQEALLKPNALISQSKSVARSVNMAMRDVEKGLGSKKNRRMFAELVRQADSGEIDDLFRYVESKNMPAEIKDGIIKYSKLNDMIHTKVNAQLADSLNATGIRDYKGSLVKVVDPTKGEVQDLNTFKKFTVSLDELSPLKDVLPKQRNYMPRMVKRGQFVVSRIDDVKKTKKVVDTYDSGADAYKYMRDADELPGRERYVAHRIGEDPLNISNNYNRSTIVGNDTDRFVGEMENMLRMFHDLGISQVPDNINQITKEIGSYYGLDEIGKGKAAPTKLLKRKRTREQALTHVEDVFESYKSYSNLVTTATLDQPYIAQFKAEFMNKYGKYLSIKGDYTSNIQVPRGDETGGIAQAAKLYQNQLINMERIPHKSQIATQRFVDDTLHKMYRSDSKLVRGMGRLLEEQNRRLPIFNTLKNLGYPMSLAGNALQTVMQGSFAHFGIIAHAGFLKDNPGQIPKYIGDATALGMHYLFDVANVGKFIPLSARQKALKAEIDNQGYLTDILGTETGGGRGLLRMMNNVCMSPIAFGEATNKLAAINMAFRVADTKGLKFGSREHRMFVSSYFPKYSQVLNRMTNSPLTTSNFTSWNVGMFKKFQLQYVDQFWFGTTRAQKLALAAFGGTMFGKFGIPGMGDAVEFYNMYREQEMQQDTYKAMQSLDYLENMPRERAIDEIKKTFHDDPETMKQLVKEYDKGSKAMRRTIQKLKETRIADLIEEGELEQRTLLDRILNFEGLLDNPAVNIGFRSLVSDVRSYGVTSMFGPTVNNILKAQVGTAWQNVSTVWSEVDEYGYQPVRQVATAEARRVAKALAPSPYKPTEAMIQLGEVIGALNREELYDTKGNLLSYTKVFEDPNLKMDVVYKEQMQELSPRPLKPATTLADIGWKLLGGSSAEVREIKKQEQDLLKHYNNVILPMVKRLADMSVLLSDDQESLELSNDLVHAYATFVQRKYGGTPVADFTANALINEVARLEYKKTHGASPLRDQEIKDIKRITERLKKEYR